MTMFYKKQIKSVWNIVKSYKYKSTFFDYFKNLLIVLLVPTLILTFGIMYFYNTSHLKAVKASGIQSNQKTKNSVEKALIDINKLNYMLFSDKNVTAYVLNTKENIDNPETIKRRKYTTNTINNYLSTSEIIESIYVYSVQSDFVISNLGSCPLNEFFDLSWYEAYTKSNVSMFIQTSSPRENGTQNALLSFVYPLTYNSSVDGLIVVNIRLSIFDEIANSSEDETVSLIDFDGKILYSSNKSSIDRKFAEKIPEFETTSSIIEKNKLYCYSKIESYPLILSTISELPASMRAKNLVMLLFTYMIFMVLLLVFLSFILSTKFYLNISDILVTLGLSGTDSVSEKSELQLIKSGILSNASKIEKIESQLFEQSDKLKNSQQTALQTQISPHFILNTLNAVNLLLLTEEKPDKALQINSLLSEILSGILNTSQYMIGIKEEVEYTKKYLEIEAYKLQKSFDVKWYIEPECESLQTIKFILQPIVENSIFHGIKHLTNMRGLIEIFIKRSGSDVIFTICDNGCGMSENKMEYFNKNAKAKTIPHDRHIGFLNVNMRLKLAYGNDYGCKIIKSDSNGTQIEIKIQAYNL